MPTIFSDAEAAKLLAESVIANFHPNLATARIRWLWRDVAAKRDGKLVPGAVRRLTGPLEHCIQADFLVEVALDVWNTLDEGKRRAVLDHLLAQCKAEEDEKSGEMKYSKRRFDVMEFNEVFQRNGAWHPDLETFAAVAMGTDATMDTGNVDVDQEIPVGEGE